MLSILDRGVPERRKTVTNLILNMDCSNVTVLVSPVPGRSLFVCYMTRLVISEALRH